MTVVQSQNSAPRREMMSATLFNSAVFLIVLAYVIVGLVEAHAWEWVTMPDSIAYLEIARQYANGNFVVRGYWSPLISWLTAILIKFGLSAELAGRYMLVLSGVMSIGFTLLLGKRFQLGRASQLGLIVLTTLVIIAHHVWITADVIGVAFLLAYFGVLTSPNVEKKPIRTGIIAGIAAGIAYFARSYNLTFILAHIVLYVAWAWWQGRSFKSVISFASALLVAMVIVISPWVYLLSARYHHFTFATSAIHTRGLVAPGAKDWITCLNGSILCNRPTDILFPWEDHLPEFQPGYNWSPLTSWSNFQHQIDLIAYNIQFFMNLHQGWSAYGLISLLLLLTFWRWEKFRKESAFFLLAAGVYIGGYMLTLTLGGTRYFIFPYIVIFIWVFYSLQYAYANPTRRMMRNFCIFVYVMIGILAIKHALDLWTYFDNTMKQPDKPGQCSPVDAQQIEPYLIAPFVVIGPVNSEIAMLEISYYTQVRTLGYLRTTLFSADELNTRLQENGIRSVLVQDDGTESVSALMTDYKYERVTDVQYCGTPFTVLYLPPVE